MKQPRIDRGFSCLACLLTTIRINAEEIAAAKARAETAWKAGDHEAFCDHKRWQLDLAWARRGMFQRLERFEKQPRLRLADTAAVADEQGFRGSKIAA